MEFKVGMYIRTLSNLIKKRIDHLSKETGLTGFQGYLIGYLIAETARRDVFQRDVEKHLEISRASVTSVLQLLEKNGFIRRESVLDDARLKKIVVTEKGVRADAQIKATLDDLEVSLREGISQEEFEIFQSVMQRIKMNLDTLEKQ